MNNNRKISIEKLEAILYGRLEFALIDVRELGLFGQGHLFFSVSCPYSRLEHKVLSLVPRKTVAIVLVDDGPPSHLAERAACRLEAIGYENVACLEGGTKAWAAAGRQLFQGANTPSKAFGELVEHTYSTPRITPHEFIELSAAGKDFILIDGRTEAEHRKGTIPNAICVPNEELPLRVPGMVKSPDTKIIVCCGGRTRSIVGAQTLINIGIPNPIYALQNGTQGWHLHNLPLEYDSERVYTDTIDLTLLPSLQEAATRLMLRFGLRTVGTDQVNDWFRDVTRTTYLFDVRSDKEFAQGSIPGAIHAPGGQLLQATDNWIGVKNARIVLIDGGEKVRAPVIASWLKQLGYEPYVLDSWSSVNLSLSRVVSPTFQIFDRISINELQLALESNNCFVFDLRDSMSFRKSHIPGSRWSVRPRLIEDLPGTITPIVLLSDDPDVAQLAGSDLLAAGVKDVKLLINSFSDWAKAGYAVESSPSTPNDSECIDYMFFLHERHAGNKEHISQYLTWETTLVEQMDVRDRALYKLNV